VLFDKLQFVEVFDKLKLVGHALPYAGAGVPPVIGGRIGFNGLVEGSFSFVPGSSC
jgi:hypothetical protein